MSVTIPVVFQFSPSELGNHLHSGFVVTVVRSFHNDAVLHYCVNRLDGTFSEVFNHDRQFTRDELLALVKELDGAQE